VNKSQSGRASEFAASAQLRQFHTPLNSCCYKLEAVLEEQTNKQLQQNHGRGVHTLSFGGKKNTSEKSIAIAGHSVAKHPHVKPNCCSTEQNPYRFVPLE
jgi:hypothetical protein